MIKNSKKQIRIWIDLDNSPHVPLFVPIMKELRNRGCSITITARDFFETCDLLEMLGEKYNKIGGRFGKNKLYKLLGSLRRSFKLYVFARKKDFSIAVGHGTRPQFLAAALLRLPVVYMFDYEFGKLWPTFGITKYMVPEYIPDDVFIERKLNIEKVVKFPGLKEEIYSFNFTPDPKIYEELGINRESIIITVRPPASEAFYHHPDGDQIFEEVVKYLSEKENVTLVVMPRTDSQREFINSLPVQGNDKIVLPSKVVDGLNLIWHSDLVVSGGGTMNREAISLGIPAYSIFKGRKSAVDDHLERMGKLMFIKTLDDFDKINVCKRNQISHAPNHRESLVSFIADEILLTSQQG